MKIVFNPVDGQLGHKSGLKDGTIELHPASVSPKYRTLEVRLGEGLDKDTIPERADLLEVGRGRFLLVPEETSDDRVLLLGGFNGGHREEAKLDRDDPDNTATIVDCEEGAGAWGFGTAFIAIFKPGEKLVSSLEDVYVWDGESLRWGKWNDVIPANPEDGKKL